MRLGDGQLEALAAVVREGSFDRAAKLLHVTPSAISQRLKQLEERVGAVLVVRASPCVATETGARVYRHAQQVEVLERDLLKHLASGPGPSAERPLLGLASNADSLATWLVPSLVRFSRMTGARVDLVVDDEDHTARWLRSGRVVGAVTSEARAVQGCRTHELGAMRYRATASPAFVKAWFGKGTTHETLRAAPALAYDRRDVLSVRFARDVFGLPDDGLPSNFLPSPQAYVEATLRGLGWGMNPESLVEEHLASGALVEIAADHAIDVPLFFQSWALTTPTLDALVDALTEEARAVLRPLAA